MVLFILHHKVPMMRGVSCKSLLVTNDEMRDHLFQLLGFIFFPRQKEKHQPPFWSRRPFHTGDDDDQTTAI
ncbi:hypothetical protein K1719_003709 [Acacia pycnantha]|nr:hypothetical protein K1719_020278 [Acacia pycnantha]KAI9125093.1 hypothetical protein K1719_003709 [Acacia pycnantha]